MHTGLQPLFGPMMLLVHTVRRLLGLAPRPAVPSVRTMPFSFPQMPAIDADLHTDLPVLIIQFCEKGSSA